MPCGSNFPFYIEQRDLRAVGAHLKHAATADGTATSGGQGAADTDIKVGATHGRAYDKGMNRRRSSIPRPSRCGRAWSCRTGSSGTSASW